MGQHKHHCNHHHPALIPRANKSRFTMRTIRNYFFQDREELQDTNSKFQKMGARVGTTTSKKKSPFLTRSSFCCCSKRLVWVVVLLLWCSIAIREEDYLILKEPDSSSLFRILATHWAGGEKGSFFARSSSNNNPSRLLLSRSVSAVVVGVVTAVNETKAPEAHNRIRKSIFGAEETAPSTKSEWTDDPMTTTLATTGKNRNNEGIIVLAGLVRDTREIRNSTWNLLMDLSCNHNVAIHIMAQHVATSTATALGNLCGPYFLEKQQDLVVVAAGSMKKDQKLLLLSENRLQRLSQIRDMQRSRIQSLFFLGSHTQVMGSTSMVILLDLDLWDVPSASDIIHRMQNMNDAHVVCGAGNWFDSSDDKLFYYDNFALVYWPDTFAFERSQRLIPHHYQGENTNIVHRRTRKVSFMSKNKKKMVKIIRGFSQYSIFEYLKKQAENDPQGLVSVRSCFGGLAMYRASTWLSPQCQYKLTAQQLEGKKDMASPQKNIFRYASREEKFPCEHVVFHDCLHRRVLQNHPSDGKSPMALDPNLVTHWRKNKDVMKEEDMKHHHHHDGSGV